MIYSHHVHVLLKFTNIVMIMNLIFNKVIHVVVKHNYQVKYDVAYETKDT
jgi:hypothetical protein